MKFAQGSFTGCYNMVEKLGDVADLISLHRT